jgi:hypothetical protein
MARRRERALVDGLIAADATPAKRKGSEGIALVQGKRRVRLIWHDRVVTKQGKTILGAEDWRAAPRGRFRRPRCVRGAEFIHLHDGTKAVTRRFDEAKGDYDFTRLCKRY